MRKFLPALAALCLLMPSASQARGVVTVYSSGVVVVGTTYQYIVYVGDITPNTVTWSVNDIPGGNAAVGTISASGLYTAPPVAPTPNIVTVKATHTVDTSVFGTVQATIQQPTPWVWGVSPNPLFVGPITLNINGAGFVPGAVAQFGGVNLTTTYVNATTLTATGTATSAQIGAVNVTVANPNPGGVTSQPKAVTLKAAPVQVTVNVSPNPVSLNLGATQQFSATVTGASNTSVTWYVNDVLGGNTTVGVIGNGGFYQAPAVKPSGSVTVRAKSFASPSVSGYATVNLNSTAPLTITSVAPSSIPVGPFLMAVTGTGFVNGSVINFGGVGLPTSYVSPTQLSANGTATAAQVGTVAVVVVNPAPNAGTSSPFAIQVTGGTSVSVTISPTSASVAVGGSQNFTATISGNANTSVTWSVNGIAGGNSAVGTVSGGQYLAPAALPSPATVTVTATSVADITKSASATVTLTAAANGPAISSIAPNPVQPGAFNLVINGSGFVSGATATFGGVALATQFVSAAQLTATGSTTPAQPGTNVPVFVTNPGNIVSPTFSLPVAASGPSISSIAPNPVQPGAFNLVINGSGFVSGAAATFGGVALATQFVSAAQLMASGSTTPAQPGTNVPVFVTNPGNVVSPAYSLPVAGGATLVSSAVAARFLEQASFGPTAASIAHVQQVGLQGYLNEQFNTPWSPYPDPNSNFSALGPMQVRFFTNAVSGPDQLRQRVVFALNQIFVISIQDLFYQGKMIPYLNMLANDCFGNFSTLIKDVTLSPAMGEYLNMVNNDKPNPAAGTLANENYARELMQLFTIGTYMLNPNGTLQLDGFGNPVFTYDQHTITEFARVYTGWTYPTQPGKVLQIHNGMYYTGPMEAYDPNHDTGSKTLLNGQILPAGQSAAKDLNDALTNVFNHPNVGPFIAKLLIQHLVTSNPSPAYVQRVAAAFNNNGTGVRGDMKAVISAILLDQEARAGDPPTTTPLTGGHLREPVSYMVGLLRALNATVDDTNYLVWDGTVLGQTIYWPQSVFNYFSPVYNIPGTALLGPEFQLHTPANAVGRVNWVYNLLYGHYQSTLQAYNIDLTSFANLASSPAALVDAVDQTLTGGQMPAGMKNYIISEVSATQGNLSRAQDALFLAATSAFYQVQH